MLNRDGKNQCEWCGDPIADPPNARFCPQSTCAEEALQEARERLEDIARERQRARQEVDCLSRVCRAKRLRARVKMQRSSERLTPSPVTQNEERGIDRGASVE